MAIDPTIPLQVRGYSPLIGLGQGIAQGISLGQQFKEAKAAEAAAQREAQAEQRKAQMDELRMVAPLLPAVQQHSADPGQRMEYATRLINDLGFKNLPKDLYNEPADFTDENLQAVSGMLNKFTQEGGDPSFQFSSTFTVKDKDDNQFIAVQRRDPSGRTPVQTMYSNFDPNGPQQPTGGVSVTGQLGLSAGEMVPFEAAKAGAKRGAELRTDQALLPTLKASIKRAEGLATSESGAESQLTQRKAALPDILKVVDEMRELSKIASHGQVSKVVNNGLRFLGFEVTEGATAATALNSALQNQVLPLLKPTFGSAFTQAEGQKLEQTILDPESTPTERAASLEAFENQLFRNITTLERELGLRPIPDVDAIRRQRQGLPQQPVDNIPPAPPVPQGVDPAEWPDIWRNDFTPQERQLYLNPAQQGR